MVKRAPKSGSVTRNNDLLNRRRPLLLLRLIFAGMVLSLASL
jgi:hypothetical protein